LVVEEAKFEREMGLLEGDGGVDSCGVAFESLELVGREGEDGPVSGGAKLEGALETVVGEEGWTEDLSECARCVAAEGVHLPEAVLSGDEALGEQEVVEGGGADMWDPMGVALDGDGSGEAGDGDGAVELGKPVVHGLAEPLTRDEESDDGDEENKSCCGEEDVADQPATSGLLRGKGVVWDNVGVGEIGEAHGLMASVNETQGDLRLKRKAASFGG
jgi:hypothetical protein